MTEKKDRRSKKDKLKDKLVGDIQKRIVKMEEEIADRVRLNEMEKLVVVILRDQITTIHELCQKGGGETKS